jgi:hypothetical protein
MANAPFTGDDDMRLAILALLIPMLAACGSSEPPGVEFERPVSSVYSTLAAVDGRVDMEGLLKSPVVSRRQTGNDTMVFVLNSDSAKHQGQITFHFSKLGDNRSHVTVDAEIPEIKANIGGSMKFLSEAKIENLLAQHLKVLARQMAKGTVQVDALDELDQAIAFTALALDPDEVNRALKLAGDSGALAAAMERELSWNSDGVGELDAADEAVDDANGAEAYGDPATGQDTVGSDASASDAAAGEPDFYGDYDSPTE